MVGGVVPEYRLPKSVFDRDYAALTELGVRIHYNIHVGRDLTLSQLRENGFSHIIITVGAQLGKTLPLDGADSDGVVDALDFLRRSKCADIPVDCARVAWRLGDREVKLIYRRTIDQMPADREEIEQLLEEGIDVIELARPTRLVVEDGKLHGLRCHRMELSDRRDASGRWIPVDLPRSDFEIPLDTLILAISQQPLLDFLDGEEIALNDRGYIEVDPRTFETSVAGVYAGGDVANDGPETIVKAAAAGKAIARSILGINKVEMLRRRSHRRRRVRAPRTNVAERQNFTEVMLTYSAEQAQDEAARCLDCHTYCSICVGVCPNLALFTYETDLRAQAPSPTRWRCSPTCATSAATARHFVRRQAHPTGTSLACT
jgi:NADPH-dependent glutamate synthase beta subunit-like oxidoreductase